MQYEVCSGSPFITQTSFAHFLGVSRGTAKKYLDGLDAIDGKYYFIPDVADRLMSRVSA